MAATDANAGAAPDPVAKLRWKVRLVLLTAPRGDDPALRDQLRRLDARWIALREREMQVMRVGGDVARRYGLDPDRFGGALVGKDGEVKDHWTEPRDPADLLAQVDAMPMRRNEVQQGSPP